MKRIVYAILACVLAGAVFGASAAGMSKIMKRYHEDHDQWTVEWCEDMVEWYKEDYKDLFTSQDWEVYRLGLADGYDMAYQEGIDDGSEFARDELKSESYDDYFEAYEEGYSDGYSAGYDEAKTALGF